MPDRVNDDLALCHLVENQEGVGRRYHAADRRIVRAAPNVGMQQQKIGESLDAGLDPPGALWRMGADVIEDRAEVGKSRKGIAKPHRPCFVQTART